MSKAKLLFDLMMYVNSRASFTAQDFAHEFGISVRMAHRYLTEIEVMGVPLYTEQGLGGGYRILKNRLFPPVLFDENEAMAIFLPFRYVDIIRRCRSMRLSLRPRANCCTAFPAI